MRDTTSEGRHRVWMLLFLLLELLPSSLQHTDRQKRQIVFPGDDDDRVFNSRPCVTPDRRPGDCIPLTSCAVLRRVHYNRLRRFFCGFNGDEPRVCCPQANPGSGTRGTPRTTPPTRRTTPPTRRTTPPTRRTTPPTRRTTPPTRRTTPPTRRTTPPTRRTNPPTRRTPRPPTRPPTSGNGDSTGDSVTRTVGGTTPSFLPKDCGLSKFPKTRVIGGREAEKGSWPWMTVVYQEKRGSKSPDCGGALVTNQHVVTAAHCVVGRRAATLSANVLSVRLGEHDLYSNDDEMNPVDVDVSSVVKHDNFNPRTYENDIAVLKLVRPVQFDTNIRPICLPYDSLRDQDLSDLKAFVAGWGTTAFNGPSSPVLREVSFEIQNQTFCREAYRADLPITDSYICAGTLDGSKDSCQGDSGGPLMSVGKEKRFYLVGIVSFGKLCATPGYPGVYTRVTKYLDWLRPHLST